MMQIVSHILIIASLLYFYRPKDHTEKWYWLGVTYKISLGALLGWIYWFQIGEGDTIFFHTEALKISQLPLNDFFDFLATAHYPVYKSEARNELFIKILGVLYYITSGNYWISATYLSIFNFAAAWYLTKSIRTSFPHLYKIAIVAFIFLPSAAFWTSGILKDTIIGCGTSLLIVTIIKYESDERLSIKDVCFTLIALSILFYMKFYLAAVFGFIMGILIFNQFSHLFDTTSKWKNILFPFFVLLLLFAVSLLNKNMNWQQLPVAIYNNYQQLVTSSGSSATLIFDLKPSYQSLMLNLPISFTAGLFRPWPWEVNLLLSPAAIEHIIYLLLFLVGIRHYSPKKWPTITWLALLYIVTLSSFLPLVAPNIGTLIRYRSAFTPLLFFLLMIPFSSYFEKYQTDKIK